VTVPPAGVPAVLPVWGGQQAQWWSLAPRPPIATRGVFHWYASEDAAWLVRIYQGRPAVYARRPRADLPMPDVSRETSTTNRPDDATRATVL
jgi:hypothetical protein